MYATVIDNIRDMDITFSPAEFPVPTPEELLYAKIKHKVGVGKQRKLHVKWERWRAADKKIRARRGTLKRLPNGEKKKAFEAVSKQLKGGPFAGDADTIRHSYVEIGGLIRKAEGRTGPEK